MYFIGSNHIPIFLFAPIFIITTFITCLIADSAQKKYQAHDPSWIVIDEVLGMFLTLPFLVKSNWLHLSIIFILFRFYDIIKFWPASWFDEKMKHGAGTIMDDIISGIYAGITYLIIFKLFNF